MESQERIERMARYGGGWRGKALVESQERIERCRVTYHLRQPKHITGVVGVSERFEFVNLTPHDLNICRDGKMVTLPSKGVVNLEETVDIIGEVEVEELRVPLIKVRYSDKFDIKLKEDIDLRGKILIVSGLFNEAIADELKEQTGARAVFAPYTPRAGELAPERDEKGRIKCIKALRFLA